MGVERSWFVRHILKRKQKRGYKERVDRILAESPNPDRELLELMREILEEEDFPLDDDVEPAESGPALPVPVPQ